MKLLRELKVTPTLLREVERWGCSGEVCTDLEEVGDEERTGSDERCKAERGLRS